MKYLDMLKAKDSGKTQGRASSVELTKLTESTPDQVLSVMAVRESGCVEKITPPSSNDSRRSPQSVVIPDPDYILEALTEKAGAFLADGLTIVQADIAAVRIVQCRTCSQFTANERTPEAGMGACAVKAWPQSVSTEPTRRKGYAPYPAAPRICEQWQPLARNQ